MHCFMGIAAYKLMIASSAGLSSKLQNLKRVCCDLLILCQILAIALVRDAAFGLDVQRSDACWCRGNLTVNPIR